MKRTPLKKGNKKLNKGNSSLKKSGKGLSKGKGLKRSGNKLKMRKKDPIEIQEERELKEKMWQLFLQIWEERGPYSELSGKYLGSECLTIFMHHILPKATYKSLTLEPLNIIVLSFEEHQKAEQDSFFYPEINKRREIIKKEFGIS